MGTDADTPDGSTPLHCAAVAGDTACAQLLLDAHADTALAAHDDRYAATPGHMDTAGNTLA